MQLSLAQGPHALKSKHSQQCCTGSLGHALCEGLLQATRHCGESLCDLVQGDACLIQCVLKMFINLLVAKAKGAARQARVHRQCAVHNLPAAPSSRTRERREQPRQQLAEDVCEAVECDLHTRLRSL